MTKPTMESVVTNQCLDLARIFDDEVGLCSWNPPGCNERRRYGAFLAKEDFQLTRITQTEDLSELLRSFPEGPGKESFQNWTKELVEIFTLLFDPEQIGLRIATTRKPMCPSFHVDHVQARLIHVLAGAGSEWIDETSFNWEDRDPATSLEDALNNHRSEIKSAGPGAVVIMKGTQWKPGNPPVIHRSPWHDEIRTVLTMDIA